MSNIIYSKFTQVYGYSTNVYIELKVKLWLVNHTVSIPIDTTSYTITEIYGLITTAWAAHAWSATTPELIIDHTSELTTVFGSADVTFVSIEVFADENNPKSLELPVILGLSRQMLESTGSIKYTFPTSPIYDPSLPYMGAWRLQTEIKSYDADNAFLLSSSVGDSDLITLETDKITDISRNTVSNSESYVVRALLIIIENVPFINLTDFDIFRSFARRGKVEIFFDFDLFGNGDTEADVIDAESGGSSVTDKIRKWCTYSIALSPKDNLY